MPEEIVLQLSHKDVNLGFFKERKQEILALRSGDALGYSAGCLYNPVTNKPVAMLSQSMRGKLSEWEGKGYRVKSAMVSFVVAWKAKDTPRDEAETAVVLVEVGMGR